MGKFFCGKYIRDTQREVPTLYIYICFQGVALIGIKIFFLHIGRVQTLPPKLAICMEKNLNIMSNNFRAIFKYERKL